MLHKLKEVIQVANNPLTDQTTKKQALDYLEQLKNDSENGTKLFVELLNDISSDEFSKFVALQFLNDIIVNIPNDIMKLNSIKTVLVEFLMNKINNQVNDPEYFKNKIAETFTRLFYCLYGSDMVSNGWNSFFDDMIQVLQIQNLLNNDVSTNNKPQFSLLGLDYFNRICLSINSEIADQTFARPKELQIKNNDIKDVMRLSDVPKLTIIWLNGLKYLIPSSAETCTTDSSNLVCITLSCIGAYVSWIEITLIVTPEYIGTIYGYLDYNPTKISCANCLCEIISKKMKPDDKLSLLSMLNLTNKLSNHDNNQLNKTRDDDVEINEAIAKLASSIGVEFTIIIDQCNDSNIQTPQLQQVATTADQHIIDQVVPLVLKYMADEYDSVTEQTFSFISQYLTVMKKLFAVGGKPGSAVALNSKQIPLSSNHQMFLNLLIQVCFKKMRIDDSQSEDSNDAIEEFNDTIRSKIKTFQDVIAVINPTLYFENISNIINNCLTNTTNINWRDLELTIYQMHNLAESIKNNLFGINKQEIAQSHPYQMMTKFMSLLLQNYSIFQIDNQYVQILFFELVVKHYVFLPGAGTNNNEDLTLLNIFCSPFGMFNNRQKVRHRTWYLFSRFIKTTKPKLNVPILTELMSKVVPLLTVKALPSNPDGSEAIDTTFDNQLYIFEGTGILIGSNSDCTYDIIDEVLKPLYTDLEKCISSQLQTPDIILESHHILMSIGTFARGIHSGLVPENQVNNTDVNQKIIVRSLIEKFSNIAEVVLVTFSFFNKHESIRDASRFTFSRLIPILHKDIIPFSSKLVVLFLESDLKVLEMNDFLSFLGQMIHMFHNEENCYSLFDNLFQSVIQKIKTLMEQLKQEGKNENQDHNNNNVNKIVIKNVVVTDSFRDLILLKKAYFSFLQSFVTNNCVSILLSERNRVILPYILEDVLSITPEELQEISTMKVTLNLLLNFIKYFGSGELLDPKDKKISKLDGLNEFFITKTIPMIFEIIFKPEYKFNVNDGGNKIICNDLSKILMEIYLQSGGKNYNDNPCLKYLMEVYFPQVQFPNNLGMELVEGMMVQNSKQFERFFISFINKIKQ